MTIAFYISKHEGAGKVVLDTSRLKGSGGVGSHYRVNFLRHWKGVPCVPPVPRAGVKGRCCGCWTYSRTCGEELMELYWRGRPYWDQHLSFVDLRQGTWICHVLRCSCKADVKRNKIWRWRVGEAVM